MAEETKSPYPGGGYYVDGMWYKTKRCLTYCGEACDCKPPNGVYILPNSKADQLMQEQLENTQVQSDCFILPRSAEMTPEERIERLERQVEILATQVLKLLKSRI